MAHRLRLDSRTVEVELMALETGSHELLAEQCRELQLEKDSETKITQPRAFECDHCGETFASWERLRQHQVDCNSDDSDDQL